MGSTFGDADFPASPYPGSRPECSFVHVDAIGRPLTPGPGGGWHLAEDGRALDEWLADHGAEPLESRRPVLAYGSNANPAKITWLREVHGLTGPVIVLRAEVRGIAAVWAAGLRVVDDQRPATLAADAEAVEPHAVWLVTDDQLCALDRCEGRGSRYDLAYLDVGQVHLENGAHLTDVLAYVGRNVGRNVGPNASRMPLLVDGVPVRCADVPQDRARHLRGDPATDDGLRVRTLAP